METPEEGAVVYKPPGKETAKVPAEGEFPDFNSYVVVTDCRVGIAIEREVSKVGMGVETAEIGGKEVHKLAVRPPIV